MLTNAHFFFKFFFFLLQLMTLPHFFNTQLVQQLSVCPSPVSPPGLTTRKKPFCIIAYFISKLLNFKFRAIVTNNNLAIFYISTCRNVEYIMCNIDNRFILLLHILTNAIALFNCTRVQGHGPDFTQLLFWRKSITNSQMFRSNCISFGKSNKS